MTQKILSRSAISNPKRMRRTSKRRELAAGSRYPATMEVLAMKAEKLLEAFNSKSI